MPAATSVNEYIREGTLTSPAAAAIGVWLMTVGILLVMAGFILHSVSRHFQELTYRLRRIEGDLSSGSPRKSAAGARSHARYLPLPNPSSFVNTGLALPDRRAVCTDRFEVGATAIQRGRRHNLGARMVRNGNPDYRIFGNTSQNRIRDMVHGHRCHNHRHA